MAILFTIFFIFFLIGAIGATYSMITFYKDRDKESLNRSWLYLIIMNIGNIGIQIVIFVLR